MPVCLLLFSEPAVLPLRLPAVVLPELLPLLLHQLGIGFIPQFFAAEALAAGDLVAIPLQCDWPRRQIYLLEDTSRPLNRWAEPLRQLLLESAQA